MMSAKTRKILITTETHEILVIRRKNKIASRRFCHRCSNLTEFINLDAAIILSGRHACELILMIEKGEVHAVETANGHLMICRRSL